jgi:hypothetical protein
LVGQLEDIFVGDMMGPKIGDGGGPVGGIVHQRIVLLGNSGLEPLLEDWPVTGVVGVQIVVTPASFDLGQPLYPRKLVTEDLHRFQVKPCRLRSRNCSLCWSWLRHVRLVDHFVGRLVGGTGTVLTGIGRSTVVQIGGVVGKVAEHVGSPPILEF